VSCQVSLFSWNAARIINEKMGIWMRQKIAFLLVHFQPISHPDPSSPKGVWKNKVGFFLEGYKKM